MLTSIAFARRGAPAAHPARFEPSSAQLDVLREMRDEAGVTAAALMRSESAREELRKREKNTAEGDEEIVVETEDIDVKYQMDDYDEEDEGTVDAVFGAGLLEQIAAMRASDLSGEEEDGGSLDEDDLSDVEDTTLRPSDVVFVGAHSEDDASHLDVYVYEAEKDNLYVHHDLLMPTFPLAVEWLDYRPDNAVVQTVAQAAQAEAIAHGAAATISSAEQHGNLVAVGSYLSGIEIWDLDVLDVLEPVFVLGGEVNPEEAELQLQLQPSAGKKRRNKKKHLQPTLREGSHTGPVMCLAWNRLHRNILASGSADHTVKVWDLATGSCVYTLAHHTKEVQALRWHPLLGTVLASGSFDRTVCVVDGATPDAQPLRFNLNSDVEDVRWNPTSPSQLVVSCEDGHIFSFETGVGVEGGSISAEPLWVIGAHTQAASSIAFHPVVPGLLATVGVDKSLKVWNVAETPTMLAAARLKMPLFAVSWAVDADESVDLAEARAWTLACGGKKAAEQDAVQRLHVTDVREMSPAVEAFSVEALQRFAAVAQ